MCDLRLYPLDEEFDETAFDLCSFVEPSCELLSSVSDSTDDIVGGLNEVRINRVKWHYFMLIILIKDSSKTVYHQNSYWPDQQCIGPPGDPGKTGPEGYPGTPGEVVSYCDLLMVYEMSLFVSTF